MPRFAVIIPAAGSSRRYSESGGVRPKLEEDLGGKSVLHRSVELFTKLESPDWTVGAIVVAGPADPEAYAEFKVRHADKLAIMGASVCIGGAAHRWETVQRALAQVPGDCTHIAVHDAARPCASLELIERLFDTALKYPAVVPAVEVGDTLKEVSEQDAPDEGRDPLAAILGEDAAPKSKSRRVIERTIDRGGVYAVQTPQVFEAGLLRRAYAQSDLSGTDDAGLVERLLATPAGREGVKFPHVVVIDGDVRNVKITRAADLRLARAILGVGGPAEKPAHKRF